MAKFYRQNSEVHKQIENFFDIMREQGITMDANGAGFYLSKDKFPQIPPEYRYAVVLDADTGVPLTIFPPVCEFKLKVFK